MSTSPAPDPASTQDARFAADTGTPMAGNDWLDAHFKAFQPEYEHALRVVGIQPGWRVLDAGCGPGGYLPLLSELVGADGRIDALDNSAEHVTTVGKRAARGEFAANVKAQLGELLKLPYPDETFDAVWCANTTQYFSDEALAALLREFMRVTKPGGLVAIKDFDLRPVMWSPARPTLMINYLQELCKHPETNGYGCIRCADLAQWLHATGVSVVRQVHVPMVRSYPIDRHAHRFICDFMKFIYHQVAGFDLSNEDLETWRDLADEASPDHITHNPSFTYREIQIVFVGHKPEAQ